MKKSTAIIVWTARIIGILAILFVSLFALDSFSSEHSMWQNLLAFLIHLIPSFALLALLVIAWKWEMTGGLIMTIAGIIFFVAVFSLNYNRNQFSLYQSMVAASLICVPFILAGILFIISHFRRKKEVAGHGL